MPTPAPLVDLPSFGIAPRASAPGPSLPTPRGPVSDALLAHLRDGTGLRLRPHGIDGLAGVTDDDLHLSLYCAYQLHHHGFAEVPDEAEWDPDVLGLRARLEQRFLDELGAAVPADLPRDPAGVTAWLARIATDSSGPSLSGFMAEHGTVDQLREFCIHRSAYQLKEADGHSWGLPRLAGEAKSAMVEIQADEYGGGRSGLTHAQLFADTMSELGLDPTYGAHIDLLPATTLATDNLVSLFGLHRRWRGALVGHLALFEMTSVGPMGRYASTFRRLGLSERARRFYDVHVEADEHHQVVALDRMVRGLLTDEPHLAADVAFGAAALTHVEGRFARQLRTAWASGRSSLRPVSTPTPTGWTPAG